MVALLAACSGSSKEFSSEIPTKGGSSGTGGGVGDGGSAGKGASSGAGSAGKGGTSGTSGMGGGTSGKGGNTSGSAGTANASGTGGTSGATQGGSSGTGEGGASGGVAIDDAAGVVAVELCDKAFECCTAEEIEASQGVSTVAQCQLAVATVVQLQVNAAKPAIEAGRVVYDGTALERCMTDYGSRTCNMLRALTSFECEGLIVPQQAEGDACGLSAECIDGYCDGGSNATNPVGHCAPLKELGADCGANAECSSGFCSGTCEELEAEPLCGG